MKKILTLLSLLIAGYYGYTQTNQPIADVNSTGSGFQQQQNEQLLAEAFRNQRSNLQIAGEGEVERILSDDLQGSRHQRFTLRLASGQSLLIAHNIDLASRIENLSEGDQVLFFGEYEWNERGGVIHWTHRDPAGRHPDGWLKHAGKTYQ